MVSMKCKLMTRTASLLGESNSIAYLCRRSFKEPGRDVKERALRGSRGVVRLISTKPYRARDILYMASFKLIVIDQLL